MAAFSRILAAFAATVFTLIGPARADAVTGPHVLFTVPRHDSGLVEYYGGPVVSNVQIVSILWGPNVAKATVDGVPEYLTAMANSTYVDQLSIYDTFRRGVNGHKGTRQHIERGTFIGQIQITPKHKSLDLTDGEIIKELKYQIGLGVLPPTSLDTWYVIYFPANITIFLPGYGYSCSDWDAYHWSKDRTRAATNNIYYAVEPACGAFDFITWTSSHEFAETLTDPIGNGTPMYPDAWVGPGNSEIGDLCMGDFGTLSDGVNSYEVQQVYLDNIPGCSTGNYKSP